MPTLVMIIWLVLGVSTPLVLHFAREGWQTQQSTLVAAPRDSFRLLQPVAMRPNSGVVVRSGIVSFETAGEQALQPAQRREQLAKGNAQLVLSFGEVGLLEALSSVSQGMPDTSPVPAASEGASAAPVEDLETAVQRHHFKSMRLRHSDVIIALPSQQRLALRSRTLAIRPLTNGGFVIAGEATWRDLDVAVSVAARPLPAEEALQSATKMQVEISLTSTAFTMAFDGTLLTTGDAGLHGRMILRTDAITEMASAFGLVVLGLGNVSTFELSADTSWTESGLAFRDAQLSIGGQPARGGLLVSTSEDRPKLSGTLDFDTLDLAPFIAAPETGTTHLRDFLNYLWRALQNSHSTQLDMDLRLSAKNLGVSELGFGRSAASLFLSDGILKADVTELTVAEGTGRAQLSVDLNTFSPSLTIRGKIENADLSKISSAVLKTPALYGTGHLRVDLTADGTEQDTLSKSLNGIVEISILEGGSLQGDLNKLVETEIATDKANSVPVTVSISGGRTAIEQLKMRIALSRGQAVCERFALTTANLSLEGSARIDLDNRNLQGQAVLRSSKKLEGRADSAILLSGTLDKPVLQQTPLASDFEREVFVPLEPISREQKDTVPLGAHGGAY